MKKYRKYHTLQKIGWSLFKELPGWNGVFHIIHSPAGVNGKIPVNANGVGIVLFTIQLSCRSTVRPAYSLWRNNPRGQLILSNFLFVLIDSKLSFTTWFM